MIPKNLLLIDYQLDNIQYINQVKLIDTDIIIIINSFDNILFNDYKKIGLLFSNNILFDKNDLINYLKTLHDNIVIENITDINYLNYINLYFDYNSNIFNLNYNESYLLSITNINLLAGFFYIYNTNLNCSINNYNGDITININQIGQYEVTVNYTIFDIVLIKKINIIIKPIIKYNQLFDIEYNNEFTSSIPEIIPSNLNGVFYLDNNDIISIDKITGIFKLNNKLKSNKYIQPIYYKINDLIVDINIELNILPIVRYLKNNYEVKYTDKFISDTPIINNYYVNNLFKIN